MYIETYPSVPRQRSPNLFKVIVKKQSDNISSILDLTQGNWKRHKDECMGRFWQDTSSCLPSPWISVGDELISSMSDLVFSVSEDQIQEKKGRKIALSDIGWCLFPRNDLCPFADWGCSEQRMRRQWFADWGYSEQCIDQSKVVA